MRVGPTWLTPSAYILSKILKARSANTKGRREYLFVCNLSVRLSPTTGGKHIFSFRCQLCTRAAASNREGIVRCKLPFEERRVTKLHRLSPRRHPPQEGEGRPRGGERRRWPQHPPFALINVESTDSQNSAWEPLVGAAPRPPRGLEGGRRSRLCAGATPSTLTSTRNMEEVRGAEEGRDIALTSSWARRSKSIRRR
jgi:hypothetical protein